VAHFESPLSIEPVSTMFINMQGDPPFIDPAVIDAVEAEINRF
jgi:CMP-2-keto-3-deoxyoctulosonic acid synthetase